ncbi:NTF2-related export protein 1 [Fukomys damarensis]|uniref:NTF2-related export protein n=1 Tax=Fukomys damarensis TaxID=885580 RepID=A0A091E5H0_FUKDA|nr:NTF2-related export protein 1 [Fukomys damarensis]
MDIVEYHPPAHTVVSTAALLLGYGMVTRANQNFGFWWAQPPWCGNAVSGQESLSEFFEMLPSSEFQINVVDCQTVHDEATPSQTTVLVVICRSVKFEGNKQPDFHQNFILTAQPSPNNTVWKIASDCFRFQDWVS